jgi:hypothetical protein
MSFEQNDVIVKFGAQTSEIESGSQKVGQILDNLKGGFEGLGSVIEHLGGAFAGVATILAGGAIFTEAIKAASDEAAEVRKLMNGLGMTAEAASKMKVALELVGISAEEYVGIAMKFDRQLKTNEDGLKKIGVVTRDQNGNLLAQDVLLKNAVSTMMQYKAGTDRNAAAMTMFGRSAEEAYKLLKLNDDVKNRAAELAEKIGEIMTPEELENVKKYKMEMAATKVVTEAFGENLGQAVMPGLTKMAQAFLEIGVAIMPIIKGAFEAAGVVFEGLGDIIKSAVFNIEGLFNDLVISSGNTFRKKLPDDVWTWAKSMQSVSDTIADAVELIEDSFAALRLSANFTARAITATFQSTSGSWVQTALTAAGQLLGGKGAPPSKDLWVQYQKEVDENHKKNLAKIAANAKAMKQGAEAGASGGKGWGGDGKGSGKDESKIPGWTEELNVQRALATQQKGYEMGLAGEQAYWEKILATQQMSAKDRQKIELAVSHIKLQILQQDLRNHRALTEEEINQQENAAKDALAIEREKLKSKLDLGMISQREYNEQLINFENAQFEILRVAQEKRIELARLDPNNPVKAQQEYSKLLQIIRQHNLSISKLTDDVTKESVKKWQDLFKGISDGFGKAMGGFIVGTMTWQKAMTGIFQSVQQSFANMIGNMISGYLQEQAMSALGIGQKKAEVPATAASAGGKAADAVAGIPVVGPAMALAAYASVFGAVMGGLASASGGYDIPAGINPLTQLHAREMVLPASIADSVRNMTGNGGGGGEVHVHIHAIDAKSFQDRLSREGSVMFDALKGQLRNFKS